jgi:hypothetical protein
MGRPPGDEPRGRDLVLPRQHVAHEVVPMRRILLGAAPAMFWLAAAHSLAQQPIATPILSSDENFRDVAGIAARYGGTGFANSTAHDGVMRTGVIYRSEELNVSNADLATLSSLHITRDFDLRTPSEIATTPDRVPAGATYINVNIFGTQSRDVVRLAPFTVTPQAGIRVAHVTLGGFQESGSELALDVNRLSHTASSLLAGVGVGLDPWERGDWTITPSFALAVELALGNPRVASTGSLYGFTVTQYAAYDSRYLLDGGLGVTAQHGAFGVKAAVNAMHGDASTGVSGELSVAYRF